MITIVSTREIRKGKWHTIYTKSCSCGCTNERGTVLTEQTKKPTDTAIIKKLNEDND